MEGNQQKYSRALRVFSFLAFFASLSASASVDGAPRYTELSLSKKIEISPSDVFESTGGYWQMNTVQRWEIEKLSAPERATKKAKQYIAFIQNGSAHPVGVKNAGTLDESYSYTVPPSEMSKGACWVVLKQKPSRAIALESSMKIQESGFWAMNKGVALSPTKQSNIAKIFCSKSEAIEASLSAKAIQ